MQPIPLAEASWLTIPPKATSFALLAQSGNSHQATCFVSVFLVFLKFTQGFYWHSLGSPSFFLSLNWRFSGDFLVSPGFFQGFPRVFPCTSLHPLHPALATSWRRMSEFTDPTKAATLFSSGSANAMSFSAEDVFGDPRPRKVAAELARARWAVCNVQRARKRARNLFLYPFCSVPYKNVVLFP